MQNAILSPGMVLGNRYIIDKALGQGGIGAVFLAHDQQLHSRRVVIKVLLQQSYDPWLLKKFQQEIEALARLDHPGIIGVFDVGQLPDGKPYLVLQFVDGRNLRSIMKESEGGMDMHRTGRILQQIGPALTAAHEQGITHCDLKPENIMIRAVEGEDLVKLIDFGIAKVRDSNVEGGETRVAGTYLYMSPEQLVGNPSASTDIYALGIIAYEMLTQEKPFPARTIGHMIQMQKEGVKRMPRQLRPDLALKTEKVLLKALDYVAENRYARARDFTEAFVASLGRASSAELEPTRSRNFTERLEESEIIEDQKEIAYVLFTDLVGYSRMAMDDQKHILHQLQDVVRQSPQYLRSASEKQLISLPTGDGMALVFFKDFEAPARCALEISSALHSFPQIHLRMGIHTGPVYRVADINKNLNVAGGGVNDAQRVMDCGDMGHILVSKSTADLLLQLKAWKDTLIDLGEVEVKHGKKIHIYNLATETEGNRTTPTKIAAPQHEKKEPLNWKLLGTVAALALIVAFGIVPASNLLFSTKVDTSPLPRPTDRMMTYSIDVQKYSGDEPVGESFLMPGEMELLRDHRIQLKFRSKQNGYLYIVNEGPELSGYNFLFPSELENFSAYIDANKAIRIPATGRFQFSAKGTEKVWMIWSANTVEELEKVKNLANSENRAVISDPGQIDAIAQFLGKESEKKTAARRDDAKKQTVVRQLGNILVHLIEIRHQ